MKQFCQLRITAFCAALSLCTGLSACSDDTEAPIVDEPIAKECENDEAVVCEGNSVKKCENNAYILTNCEDNHMICKDGACIQKEEPQHECENDMPAYCEDDVVVKCANNEYDKTTVCGDTELCRDGDCVALGKGEVKCGNDYKPVCSDHTTITSCVDRIVHETSCDTQICKIGEDGTASCVDPQCNVSDPAVCDGSGIKKCIDGVWTTEPCGDNMTCDAEKNACVSLEDACPDDDNKTDPGVCGCGIEDADSDGDGVFDCVDECPNNKYLFEYDPLCNDNKQCDMVHVSIDGKDYCANMITNAQELIDFRNNINDNKLTNTVNTVFALMEDIDFHDVFPSGESDWTGIKDYKGKFVSDGKTIKFTNGKGGLGSLNCAHDRCGLFQSLINARIDNIKLEFNVTDSNTYERVGMLVGEATGSEITNINAKGTVTTGGHYEGGIVGHAASSKIRDVKFEGNIVNKSTTGHRYIGGIAGLLTVSSALENAEVIGHVTTDSAYDVGGIVGSIEKNNSAAGSENGLLKNASFKGSVKASSTAHDSMGGIVGRALDSNISEVKFDGSVEGNTFVGGIAGQALITANYADSKNPASLTNAEVSAESTVKGRSYVGGIVGSSQIELKDLTVVCKINAKRIVGGIVGQQKGAMSNLTNHAEITIVNDLSNTASVGGIVGELYGGFNHSKLTNTKNITVNCTADKASYCDGVGGVIGLITNETIGTSLTDIKNSGNVNAKGSYIGGIVGQGTSIEFQNVENTGNIVAGGNDVGGVIGELYYRDSAKSRKVNFKMDNAKNSGNISGATSYVGGAIGNLQSFNAGESLVLNNIVNKGNIHVTGDNVGGFLGNIQQNGTVTIKDVYNTGAVKSTGSSIGGFIGSISAMNDSNKCGPGARTISITIDRASATGDVSGNQHVGGFIGYLSTHFENRYIEKQLEVICEADPTVKNTYDQWKWFNATNDITIRNAFAHGNVEGTANIGGFIGYAEGSSQNSQTFTNTKYAYIDYDANNHCKWTALSTATDPGVVYTYNRRGRLTIANAYAAGSVTRKSGSATTVGGFIGNINFATANANWNWLINNVYQTGSVTEAGGAFFGMKPTTTTIHNAYYWHASGTPFNVPANSNNNANLETIKPFNYENAIPYIMKNGEISKNKLKDMLNTNIHASANAELNDTISKLWENIDFMLGTEKVSIPTITEVTPAE